MMRTPFVMLPGVLTVLGICSTLAMAAPEPPARLRCEWLSHPLNVQAISPRLSWEVQDARRGVVQSAFEIHVATTPERAVSAAPDVWSSGVIESRETMNVAIDGAPLRAAQRYHWTVRTRDALGEWGEWAEPTFFATGDRYPGEWGGAQWIGDPSPAPEARPARNGFHTQFSDRADVEKWVTIDLGEPRAFDRVTLWPARPHDFSADVPGFCFPVRFAVLASDDPAFQKDVHVVADRRAEDAPIPGTRAVVLEVPRTSARYVRLLVTRQREATPGKFAVALAEMQIGRADEVLSNGAAVTSADSIEHNDWSTRNLTDADLVSHKATGWEALPAPTLRREFGVEGDVTRATLYITALGVYEARLNGERIGDHQLAPEWTDYDTRVQYQAYDVTDMVNAGDNAVGVFLGDGWYAGRIGMAQQFTDNKRPRAVYGRFPRLLAHLRIEKADGTEQSVVTDGSWSSTIAGPIRTSDMLDGEVYDARREMIGFDMPGYSADAGAWTSVQVDTSIETAVVPQMNEPIRVIETIKPISMSEPTPGVYVFDFGQNMPGWCRIRTKGKAGATVQLRHAEAVNDDGTVYTANLRGAPQIDRYTLAGRPEGETWEPRFTYHGFRFVEWTGDAEKPTIDSLEGVVITSDAPMVGTFECSSPMLNQLWSNILWTQHANTMSVPTDCPQRDERLGWMGDILAFAQTASFNKDMAAFYTKWLLDVRDAQADDGRFPDVAPHPFGKNRHFTGVPAWGDAGVFVPWCAYENYADTRLLAAHFDAACRWIDWIESKNPDLLWRNARHNDYNDWLNGDTLIAEGWPRKGGEAPRDVFATAFFARSTHLVAEMAKVLGREKEAAHYADLHERIREAFNAAFVGSDAKLPGDTQAEYALALGFDLLPEEKRAAAVSHLVRGVESYNGHLSTGFHSTHHAMIELTRAGHADLAYTLVNNTSFPSWGYSIENGATTIWERWDGYVKGRGFQNPGMNSLNHWALGSVGEWMMRTIIGINNDPATPGWSHFELRPVPGGGLTHAKGSFHSPRGLIESAWRVEGDATVYDFTIPPNTTARVRLAATDAAKITEGGTPLTRVEGVKVVAAGDGEVVVDAVAGKYTFRVLR